MRDNWKHGHFQHLEILRPNILFIVTNKLCKNTSSKSQAVMFSNECEYWNGEKKLIIVMIVQTPTT